MSKPKKHDSQQEPEVDKPEDAADTPAADTLVDNAESAGHSGVADTGDTDISEILGNIEKSVNSENQNQPEEADEAAALRREVESLKDSRLRLMAEFDNYKRRSSKEYERLIESANEKLIIEMVDVRENFERALKAGESGGEFAPFFEGMKLIFAKFEETLGKNGLTAFAVPGEPFDPMIHDALMNAPHPEIPADHIAEVFERGYRLKDKVIKHARVIVSSGPQG